MDTPKIRITRSMASGKECESGYLELDQGNKERQCRGSMTKALNIGDSPSNKRGVQGRLLPSTPLQSPAGEMRATRPQVNQATEVCKVTDMEPIAQINNDNTIDGAVGNEPIVDNVNIVANSNTGNGAVSNEPITINRVATGAKSNDMNQVLQMLTKLQSDNEITQIKLSEIQTEIVKNGDVIRNHMEETDLRLQQLAGHISNITRSVQFNHEQIKANDASNDNLREEIKRMQNEMQKYENRMVGMQADANQAKREVSALTDLTKRNNFIIENLREIRGERIDDVVQRLFDNLGVTGFKVPEVEAIYRLGTGNGKTNRPVMVRCVTFKQKKEVFDNASRLHNNAAYPKVKIGHDLNRDQIKQRRELGCIHALAKDRKILCKFRDNHLLIGGKNTFTVT